MNDRESYTEEMIFQMFKDAEIGRSHEFRAKLDKKGIVLQNPGKVFVRITNYQIKKYGCALGFTPNKGIQADALFDAKLKERGYYE